MESSVSELIVPIFFAGILTFLAPCTFPLLPAFFAFISGSSVSEMHDESKKQLVHRKILLNALMYVLGFGLVFTFLGSALGLIGFAFAPYKIWLARISGIFVIFFGLYLLGLHRLKVFQKLSQEKRLHFGSLTPGKPASSLLLGAAFAFGWTPCVGPILGSVLFLAASEGTVGSGAFLLFVFSLGLAIPFLIVAALYGQAVRYLKKINKFLTVISYIGGVFLILVGYLLLTHNFERLASYFYQWFSFINYESILDHL